MEALRIALAGGAVIAAGCTNDYQRVELGAGAGSAGPGSVASTTGMGRGGAGGEPGDSGVAGGRRDAASPPPRHCKAIKTADPSAVDGDHLIDPDGEGPGPAFLVHCEMDLLDGGWTRFNWVQAAYPMGADPLGQSLDECEIGDQVCRGRIPSSLDPSELLVKDTSDGHHAAWLFDPANTTSQAVLGALRDKTTSCQLNDQVFMPYSEDSSEAFCGNGLEGGCDSFMYDPGPCTGNGSWVLELDGDLFWCAGAFKMGATQGGGCSAADHGYLNECDCDDEFGELYFR